MPDICYPREHWTIQKKQKNWIENLRTWIEMNMKKKGGGGGQEGLYSLGF